MLPELILTSQGQLYPDQWKKLWERLPYENTRTQPTLNKQSDLSSFHQTQHSSSPACQHLAYWTREMEQIYRKPSCSPTYPQHHRPVKPLLNVPPSSHLPSYPVSHHASGILPVTFCSKGDSSGSLQIAWTRAFFTSSSAASSSFPLLISPTTEYM